NLNPSFPYHRDVLNFIEAEIKFEGYVNQQRAEVKKMQKLENTFLPVDLDYDLVQGLSTEIRQKLSLARPHTLGAASRISGITPAALTALHIFLTNQKRDMTPLP